MQYSCKNAGYKQKCSSTAKLYIWVVVSHSEDSHETVHDRIYLIREALGESRRKALSQAAFAELLNTTAAAMGKPCRFEETMIGRMETKRVPTTEEAEVIAAVDPLARGPVWLAAWGMPPVAHAEVQRDYAGETPGTAERAAKKKTPAKRAAGGKGKR